jgi:serine/threonine protein kinase
LKSSNILLGVKGNLHDFSTLVVECHHVYISDFESSAGTVGTGLWRAPEILLALKNGNLKPETFTAQSDVYSYALTCYEVLTGEEPFHCHQPSTSDYDAVFRGKRPTLPYWLPLPIANLISQCWYEDPLQRPSFEVLGRKLDRLINCNLPLRKVLD